MWSFPSEHRGRDDGGVQVIASPRTARPPLGAVVVGIVVGFVLLAGGLFLAWLAFTTPVIGQLTPSAIRPNAGQMAIGAAVWGVMLVAPPSFAIVGALRLGQVVRALTARPAPRSIASASASLGDDYISASDVRLPEGRLIRDLVLGPFGLAVITDLPDPRLTRHSGTSWEIRGSDGRWAHFENPVERTARDAERVRSWVMSTERDFVVKVFAAVVTSDPTVGRTATCAVVTAEQIPGWLASLPPARSLTTDRRQDLVDRVGELV
jgi:hypothetical protein